MPQKLDVHSRDAQRVSLGGRRGVRLEIIALIVCLLGLLGFLVAASTLKRTPESVSRVAILGLLAAVCAPFLLLLVRRPQPLLLIPPTVLIFLLFPIAAPHGVVYYRDPVFNFHFAYVTASTGIWAPGSFPVWARVYSYYPIGNVFLGIAVAATGAPAAYAFAWAEPLVRLLALPTAVYATARRFYEPRVAALSVFFYLGTASILFNNPVQQGMGSILFGLSVLALAMMATVEERGAMTRLRILLILFSTGLVFTHHLSSYLFGIWLGAVGGISLLRSFRKGNQPLRLELHLDLYLLALAAYIAVVATPVLLSQLTTAENFLVIFFQPQEGGGGTGLGHTFATWEVAWLGLATVAPAFLAYLTIRDHRARDLHPFLVVGGLASVGMLAVTFPLLATKFNYIPLRISEFTNFLVAPLAAQGIVRWTRAAQRGEFRILRWPIRRGRPLLAAGFALVLVVILMGGNLAPLSLRPYYEAPEDRFSDSPLYLGDDGLRAAEWGNSHFGPARVWSDQLGLSVFAGFANMDAEWGQYRVFANATMNVSTWGRLQLGDYIVVDRYMLTALPDFLDTILPTGPLPPANVNKFASDPNFALVYEDATFSVYRVMSLP